MGANGVNGTIDAERHLRYFPWPLKTAARQSACALVLSRAATEILVAYFHLPTPWDSILNSRWTAAGSTSLASRVEEQSQRSTLE